MTFSNQTSAKADKTSELLPVPRDVATRAAGEIPGSEALLLALSGNRRSRFQRLLDNRTTLLL